MAGLRPVCIVGCAGTINTGAVDDLNALADLCAKEDIWFHVDGAIGAVAVLAENIKPQLAGIERADSVALDLHKWMHIPFEAGCVLVQSIKPIARLFLLPRNTLPMKPAVWLPDISGLVITDYSFRVNFVR